MLFWSKKRNIVSEIEKELTHFPLTIQGQIPKWLAGTLIRNGPTKVTIDGKSKGHWLDGLAMLHAFNFSNEQVRYSNRFLRTTAYSQVFNKGSLDYPAFAVDPCRSLFKRFFTMFVPQSGNYLQNANVNITKIANRYVALTETPLPVEFDLETLETLGVLKYEDNLPKKRSWESAHPHYLMDEKNAFNYYIQYGRTSYYVIYSLSENKAKRNIICKIPVESPSYMHSFAITENYLILTEFPFTVKPLQLLMNIQGKAFIKNFLWRPESGTNFIVLNRHTGHLVSRYKTKPFFAFHHVNAYEYRDEIHLDLVCYDNPNIIEGLANHFSSTRSQINEDQFSTRLERFRLSLTKCQIQSEVIFSDFIEFPRINERMDGKNYQYVYLIDPRQETLFLDIRPIYKINTQTKQFLQWSEPNCYPGEPVFVASPEAREEDEGVVLSIIFNKNANNSFLLTLDAKTFREIARANIPHKIPAGLHGQYFSQPSVN